MISQKLQLFPSTIWKYKIPADKLDEVNTKLLTSIAALKTHPRAKFSKNKWYTPNNLQELPEFAEICEYILDASHAVLKDISVKNYKSAIITGCWGNISSPGATHHKHSHPNNYLSGVYYLKSEKGSDSITFHDPRPQTGLIRPEVTVSNHETSETARLLVETGDIVLFPHWLNHSVVANTSNEDRISIAFNIMFKDYVETMTRPMW